MFGGVSAAALQQQSQHEDEEEEHHDGEGEGKEAGEQAEEKEDEPEELPALASFRMLGHRRNTVSAEVYNAVESSQSWTPPVFEKSAGDAAWLTKILHTNSLFKHLDDRELKIVVSSMNKINYTTGQVIYTQGISSYISMHQVVHSVNQTTYNFTAF